MRLLKLNEFGTPVFADDYNHSAIPLPPYAILSHTWYADDEEVTFEDICNGLGHTKAGFEKIRFCGQQARTNGLAYFWVDCCCIDKRNSTELSEAINSMFRWYQSANRCFVYLSDVSGRERDGIGPMSDAWKDAFRSSRWWQRGWTLQELLAPQHVLFYNREGHLLGDKVALEGLIYEITKIPVQALRGASLASFPIDERLRWAAERQTTKPEDKAYCLFGIFNVFLPLIYGEGNNAFIRLREAISKHGNDFDHRLLAPTAPALARPTGDAVAVTPTRERDSMANWTTTLAFDQMHVRQTTVKDAQPKTCEWLLTHPIYRAWNSVNTAKHSEPIFWINGKPGAGKSTIMKYALKHAQKHKPDGDIIVSFFFNARGEKLEKITEGMYRTLLHQVLKAAPDLQYILEDICPSLTVLDQHCSLSLGSLQSIFSSAVTHLGRRRLRCFIDALDECDEEQVQDMVDTFEDLVDSSTDGQLLVCFASRHYPTIQIRNAYRLVLEDQEGHSSDLTKYIQRNLRAGSGKKLREVRAQIQKKANGVFLWAVLVVNISNKEFQRGRIFAVEKRLQEIPEGLSELFTEIVHRDSINMKDLLLCLQWILFAKRPLKLEEFYFAMAAGLHPDLESSSKLRPEAWDPEDVTTEDMTRFVLNSSKGLAELTKSRVPTVQFIHESVRSFLIDDGGLSDITPCQINNLESSSHERLKECCQNYLPVDLEFLELAPSVGEEQRQLLLSQFPFLEYANQYVLHHADSAASDISQEAFLDRFPIFPWIDVANRLERYEIRRRRRSGNILYILAELNLPRLILEIRRNGYQGVELETWLVDPGQRYEHVTLAAFANAHLSAIKALHSEQDGKLLEEIQNDPGFGRLTVQLRTGEDVLAWAKRTGNLALAALVLDKSPSDWMLRDPSLCTLAVLHNRTAILENLLDRCTDTNSSSGLALFHAISYGDNGLIQVLLNRGDDINHRPEPLFRTPLMAATIAGRYDIVDLLLERSADVHAVDIEGETALTYAARFGHTEVVRQLLAAGAEVDLRRKDGGTALLVAAEYDHSNVVDQLLAGGADISVAKTIHGETALLLAAKKGHSSVVRQLLAGGADINAMNHKGQTSLTIASENGHSGTIQVLERWNTKLAEYQLGLLWGTWTVEPFLEGVDLDVFDSSDHAFPF